MLREDLVGVVRKNWLVRPGLQCESCRMDWSGVEGNWWRLRRATWADEAAIAEHGRGSDPLWIGIAPGSPSQRAHQVLGEFIKGAGGDFGLVHLVVSKDSDAILGMVGAQERGADTVELVYGIAPAWRRRGLASAVLSEVTRAAVTQDESRRYELVIAAANSVSVRVAEKCGYRFDGVRRSFVEATGESFEDLVYVPTRSASAP